MRTCTRSFAQCAGGAPARSHPHERASRLLRDPALWVWAVVALFALLPIGNVLVK